MRFGTVKYSLAFVFLFASLAVAATGKLTGTVVDNHGVPEKYLALEVRPLDMASMGTGLHTETDQDGRFSITIVVGRNSDGTLYGQRWAIYPHHEYGGTGYYPPNNRFYGTDQIDWKEVNVTPEAPDSVVELKLGPKAGALLGKVTDAVTGAPIKPYANVVVAWASQPAIFIATNTELAGEIDPTTGQWRYYGTIQGKYRVLVPPDTELTVKATAIADGYKPYKYEGVISVGSGQDKVLDIQLQREDK